MYQVKMYDGFTNTAGTENRAIADTVKYNNYGTDQRATGANARR